MHGPHDPPNGYGLPYGAGQSHGGMGAPNFAPHLGAARVKLEAPKAWELRGWRRMTDVQRIKFLRERAEEAGRDPRLRNMVAQVLRQAGVEQRQYREQASALLKWVQANVQYLNEPDEMLQDPLYTLDVGFGDCDDLALLLGAMYEAIRLSWRYVLAGRKNGQVVRWIEGQPFPHGAQMAHIYLAVGWPPFRKPEHQTWAFVEPTIKTAPLGWDTTQPRAQAGLPELGAPALGASGSALVGGGVAAELLGGMAKRETIATVAGAVVIGVATTVLSQIVLDGIQSWRKQRRKR